ncbi:MAG: family 43 glycosylhydrolase [Chitinispirillaceae bacterium]|nr:family 43 glycosylhydrolase [Chitinispirillaceae bacterium]
MKRVPFFHSIAVYSFLGIIVMPVWLLHASSMLTSFKPGKDWMDVDGKKIDCHAGNIVFQEETGTFFWFGEHRGSPAGASCYSSQDLYNWKYRGVALNTGATEGLKGGFIERPKVAYNKKTKKYVMWFHYETSGYGLAHQGVAVCDSAPGPYKFLEHFRPNGNQSRDIGMFSDENGKTYIGYAANRGTSINADIRMVELSEDYLTVTKNDVVTNAHCEGPGVLKWNNKYYLLTSQCKGWTPNPATYYTASEVCATYTDKGSPCIGDTKNTTFDSQPGFIFKIPGYTNGFLYMGDRWNGGGSTNSQYVFLPIIMTSAGKMELRWHNEWKYEDIFTPTPVYERSISDFSTHIYVNAVNNGTLHGYDLLGRDIPYLYQNGTDRTVMNLNRGRMNAALSKGMYLIR